MSSEVFGSILNILFMLILAGAVGIMVSGIYTVITIIVDRISMLRENRQ